MKQILIIAIMGILLCTTDGIAAMVTTDSGLRYEDHKISEALQAISGKRVEVHYSGWL